MLLKIIFVIGMLRLAVTGWDAVAVAPLPKACTYARHGAETSQFLEVVDRVYNSLQADVVRVHPNWSAEYATTCFAADDSPGSFVRLIERQRHVQLAPSITAGYYKRMGELGIVRVVRFRNAADAQRCSAAIEEARAWASTRPYNPEFIEPLQTRSPVLICGAFLVEIGDGPRGYPNLRAEYGAFRGRFYEALRAATKQ